MPAVVWIEAILFSLLWLVSKAPKMLVSNLLQQTFVRYTNGYQPFKHIQRTFWSFWLWSAVIFKSVALANLAKEHGHVLVLLSCRLHLQISESSSFRAVPCPQWTPWTRDRDPASVRIEQMYQQCTEQIVWITLQFGSWKRFCCACQFGAQSWDIFPNFISWFVQFVLSLRSTLFWGQGVFPWAFWVCTGIQRRLCLYNLALGWQKNRCQNFVLLL